MFARHVNRFSEKEEETKRKKNVYERAIVMTLCTLCHLCELHERDNVKRKENVFGSAQVYPMCSNTRKAQQTLSRAFIF